MTPSTTISLLWLFTVAIRAIPFPSWHLQECDIRKRRERDSAKREQERETERGFSDEGNEERERGGETAADLGLPVVGEVRWQSINIQNRRRVRETEGGRTTEQASKQVNERAATDRERENDGKERETPRQLRLSDRSLVRSFVRSFLRPQSPTDLNPE
ncbi:hypothetical protein ALC53_08579 [Atta colombica]|uniref:Uncharacterized protein n=1 Tax=Atta colombica TaxID=520822 RepID=A0A151I2U9_9HYME|nr:hypothetical protein ALC53_08579 [Atta colombica]